MIQLTINGTQVQVPQGTTILEAARTAGIDIPTLCYWKDLNEVGACRVCVVEVQGSEKLSAACNTPAEDGMVVLTHSPRALAARTANVQLLLSKHNSDCPTCVRSGNCSLQKVANDLNLRTNPFGKQVPDCTWDETLPLIRDNEKCIACMRCIEVCDRQALNVWDLIGTGARTRVDVRGGLSMTAAGCSLCGQCITHCPVGALRERDDTDTVLDAIADPNKTVVVQVAPAVRAAWGEGVGLSADAATEKRMVAALRRLGVDYVFDTNFAADLTIMEEASEFLGRVGELRERKLPMFTSCCPGWVRFCKHMYPDLVPQLSSAKSPQQMFGAVTKSYFAQKIQVDPKDIFCLSVMPCTAKKYESAVPQVNDAADRDVDCVITTREFDRLLKTLTVPVADLPEEEFDNPLGSGTGAAVIFGTTGGVMEAALRTAAYMITGENPDADAFHAVRGMQGWREATFEAGGITVRTAVVNGLGNAKALIDAVLRGEVEYDFVEVMACPGGCAGGGGQPIHDGCEMAEARGNALRALDVSNTLRFSHENSDIQALYREYLEAPLSHKAHELLHTEQQEWTL